MSEHLEKNVAQSERRNRILNDPRRHEALENARRRIAAVIDEGSEFSLTKLRLQAGLSQTQLAKLVGSRQPAIARLEKGEIDPGVSTIIKLSQALGVVPEAVLRASITTKAARREAAS